MKPRRLPLAIAVWCVLAGAFLLATGRERPYGDARIVYEAAESMQHGSIAIKTEWPPMSHKGADGKVYSQYALLPSLAHLPGRLVYSAAWSPRDADKPGAKLALVLTSHLSTAFAAALACALLFALSTRLASRRAALVATAIVAFGSLVFVYARYPMSEAIQAACIMGYVYELARIVRGEQTLRRGIALGAWAGAVVNAKSVLLLGVAGGALAAALLVRERAALKRLALGALAGGAPWLVMLLVYNHARWGSPFDTGYGETLGMMRESIPTGLLGLLLSPGKGLLWFSPAILLSVLALAWGWRAHRTTSHAAEARNVDRASDGDLALGRADRASDAAAAPPHRALVIIVLAVVVPPLVFYARFLSWSGDYCWGPRYLVFAIAPLSILLAPWLEQVAGRLRRWLVRGVVGASVVVQLLGASLFWDHWIRLSREARLEWLGNPNRAGAAIAEAGRGHCDSCFEDMYGHQWLPPFSPITGHAWLLRHLATGDTWDAAQADAPWRRYTSLTLARPRSIYQAVRLDWWALDASGNSATVALVFVGFAGALVVFGALVVRRRKDDA